LKKLDLRWNDLGTSGAKVILQALSSNVTIHFIEVVGNKVSEDVMHSLDQLLQRNRGEGNGIAKVLYGGSEFRGDNEVPFEILQKEKDFADELRAKYEA